MVMVMHLTETPMCLEHEYQAMDNNQNSLSLSDFGKKRKNICNLEFHAETQGNLKPDPPESKDFFQNHRFQHKFCEKHK